MLHNDVYRNVTFYTGDITFPDDLAEAITKVSHFDRNSTIDYLVNFVNM